MPLSTARPPSRSVGLALPIIGLALLTTCSRQPPDAPCDPSVAALTPSPSEEAVDRCAVVVAQIPPDATVTWAASGPGQLAIQSVAPSSAAIVCASEGDVTIRGTVTLPQANSCTLSKTITCKPPPKVTVKDNAYFACVGDDCTPLLCEIPEGQAATQAELSSVENSCREFDTDGSPGTFAMCLENAVCTASLGHPYAPAARRRLSKAPDSGSPRPPQAIPQYLSRCELPTDVVDSNNMLPNPIFGGKTIIEIIPPSCSRLEATLGASSYMCLSPMLADILKDDFTLFRQLVTVCGAAAKVGGLKGYLACIAAAYWKAYNDYCKDLLTKGSLCADPCKCKADGSCDTNSAEAWCSCQCVNTNSDSANCGSCGKTCPSAQDCETGACSCPLAGQTLCGAQCTNTSFDPANCGTCGQQCGEGEGCCSGSCTQMNTVENCGGGGCGAPCQPPSNACCSGTCADTSNDAQNCGSCGNSCQSGFTCCNGTCTQLGTSKNCFSCGDACGDGYDCCGGTCTELGTDKDCAKCGNACGACESCCNGQCTNIDTDKNCGSCGTESSCQSGSKCCGGCGAQSCANTSNDPKNCGSCGNACTPGELWCVLGTTNCLEGPAAVCNKSTCTCPGTLTCDGACLPSGWACCPNSVQACPIGTTCCSDGIHCSPCP
jgi:hypothetical protein